MTAGSTPPDGGQVRQDSRRGGQLITVSAAYGAGGSIVAPALARRLGVPFLQRVTGPAGPLPEPHNVAERLTDEEARHTPVHRLLASFTQAMPAGPTQSPPPARHHDTHQREGAETEIRELLADGQGVILGRAAAVVLGKDRGFHVRLDGPPVRRIAQGAQIEGISAAEAADRLQAADRARTAYVRRLYHVDPADVSIYHLVIDSTAIPVDTVVGLILTAAAAAAATDRGVSEV
jgi:cytidylate kinase